MFDDLLDLFERKSRRGNRTVTDDRELDDERDRRARADHDKDDWDDEGDERRPRSRKRRLGDLLDFD